MENLPLTLSLFAAGLIIGLMLRIAVAATVSGICDAIYPGSAQHKVGMILLMIYVPVFAFLMRNMTEVTPMIVGVVTSCVGTSIAVLINNIRATKNPQSLPKAG